MLGRAVADPHRVESGGREDGLGLLPVATTLAPEKITRRVRARWLPDGPDVEGYEIHVGETVADPPPGRSSRWRGAREGCVSADGRVWGTYLHGLFESGAGRRRVLDGRAATAGHGPAPRAITARLREAAYDRLADTLAACARSARAARARRRVRARDFFLRSPVDGGVSCGIAALGGDFVSS